MLSILTRWLLKEVSLSESRTWTALEISDIGTASEVMGFELEDGTVPN